MPDKNITPPWESWPPPSDTWRLAQYELYRMVLLGNHREVFRKYADKRQSEEAGA